jgi:hypothetical protein
MDSMSAGEPLTRYNAARPALCLNAKVIMVNGSFLLRPNWEKVAGQTWSTRPYCRPQNILSITQPSEFI